MDPAVLVRATYYKAATLNFHLGKGSSPTMGRGTQIGRGIQMRFHNM